MDNKHIAAVILAAGEGKRMQSELPKVLHEIAGKPLLFYSIDTLKKLSLGQLLVVLKYKYELIAQKLEVYSDVAVAIQGEQYGTGKALEAALLELNNEIFDVLAIYADNAMFVKPETYQKVIDRHQKNHNIVTFATREVDEPKWSGRIVRDVNGKVTGIVEKKDATEEQLATIKEVNPGLYLINKQWLNNSITKLVPSPVTNEYYITDLISIALQQNMPVEAINMGKTSEWKGVTTQDDIRVLSEWIKANPSYA